MLPKVIAIDGPAGSGKSTLGVELAEQLGYSMLDAGVVYRAAAWICLDRRIAPDDEAALATDVAPRVREISVHSDSPLITLILSGVRVDLLPLYSEEVTATVPVVARNSAVRAAVRHIQAVVGTANWVVLAGRDIGTVVAPDAELKLYLDVSLSERAARRRWGQGSNTSMKSQTAIESELALRDRLDSERRESPLRRAHDAVVLRTDKLSVDETISLIVSMCGLSQRPPHRLGGD